MASATSTSLGKRARASSVSTAQLLLSVGAMAGLRRQEGFWVFMAGSPRPDLQAARTDAKHWPTRGNNWRETLVRARLQNLVATVACIEILRRMPFLRHRVCML
jgi:hypothetical protein